LLAVDRRYHTPESGIPVGKQIHALNVLRDPRWDGTVFQSHWDDERIIQM
jgi:hypothetical protein